MCLGIGRKHSVRSPLKCPMSGSDGGSRASSAGLSGGGHGAGAWWGHTRMIAAPTLTHPYIVS